MPYVGPAPNPGQNREVDDISSSFNGSTTAFTLQVNSQNVSPGSANAIIVSLGGVVQNPGTDYTIAASTITFTTAPADGLSFFGLVLGQQIDTEGTADGSITLAKFVNGTSSNNGKFLRANNGAIPSFETVTSTTINNNADNRVITGSDTANTLNGESNVVIDSSGQMGIGVTPDDLFHLKFGTNLHMRFNDDVDSLPTISSQQDAGAYNGFGLKVDNLRVQTGTSPTERVKVDASGNTILTGDASGGGDAQKVQFSSTGDVILVKTAGTNASNHGMIAFRDGNNTFCGQITSHGTNHTTSYGTSSDYRLKENEVLISDGITRLKQLKPYRFKWKSSGNEVDGFFAHEAQTVVPEAITGTKDEVDSDKNPIYQGIDQSKLVPLLTAALQEAITKIETLETKVAALEAA